MFNIAVTDADKTRAGENLAAVCELAQTMKMQPLIEFFDLGGCVPSLKSAMALIETGKIRQSQA
jgi:hypothetical protein